MQRLYRDPLIHFILLGGLLYAAFALVPHDENNDAASPGIAVTRAALSNFVQHRTNNFNAAAVGDWLDARTPAQLQAIIDDYVVEERKYREALALGLDEADDAIRQRLVQQMDYLEADDTAETKAANAARLAGKYGVSLSPEISARLAADAAP